MDKSLIINKIIEYYKFKKDADFARLLGITAQTLSNWKARNTYDAELIYTKCLIFNAEWLLTGEGEMLKSNKNNDDVNNDFKEKYYKSIDEVNKLLKENIRLRELVGAEKANTFLDPGLYNVAEPDNEKLARPYKKLK